MTQSLINLGPITSFNSLVFHLSAKIKGIRESYIAGQTPDVVFDFRNARTGNVSVSALTALLSISNRLKDYIGYPIPLVMKWDPELQGFLADIGFIELANKHNIFQWEPKGILGGYEKGHINPNSKIMYYSDLKPIKELSSTDYALEKSQRKQRIAPHFLLKCSSIFNKVVDKDAVSVIANTTLELIVNSLIHGEDIAFVGLQKRKHKITISVCDSGIGFPKSLSKTFPTQQQNKKMNHGQGIVLGSLIQKYEHGLRLAIGEVLNFNPLEVNDHLNEGWVTISSFDTEVRWQKKNWRRAISYFETFDFKNEVPEMEKILGSPVEQYIDRDKVEEGYWKIYDNYIVGTRIAFEINLFESNG